MVKQIMKDAIKLIHDNKLFTGNHLKKMEKTEMINKDAREKRKKRSKNRILTKKQ